MKAEKGARSARWLALGIAFLSLVGCQRRPQQSAPAHAQHAAAPATAAPPTPAVQRWHCPMHPSYIADHPGDCPVCGMQLVPIESPVAPQPAEHRPVDGMAAVELSSQRQQLIGLKNTVVRRVPFAAAIRTSGRIIFDETRIHHVHTRYEAYVEHLYADFVGKYVKRGEPLVAIYSPELLTAEQEYLLALGTRGNRDNPGRNVGIDLVESARQKLLLWNISASDIQELERRGQPSHTLKLYAPAAGYVVAKTAVHGMRVKPEDSLFDIVDLSQVWVLADIYEYELPRLQLGQSATVTVSFWPGKKWEGRVTYIFPWVDTKTRTVRVRLDVANPQGELKAEMFADVLLQVAPRSALVIPEDAVLESGVRKVVFVLDDAGVLRPREIQTGDRADHLYEARSGLSEGERVATGASFLLDSESRLQSALGAMSSPSPDGGSDGGRK